jgi:AcrR family transcriptional regulator
MTVQIKHRDSDCTRAKIIAGLERLITREGFTGVGVNAVAREAGVDKVLIYRYFGSMEGLLECFASEKILCPRIADIFDGLPDDTPLHEIAARIVIEHAEAMLNSPLAQELAIWELTEQNPLTRAFEKRMEQTEMKALAERGIIPDEDLVALVTVLLCGLQFMILQVRNDNPIMNIDYSKPESKEMVKRVISMTMKAFFESRERGVPREE